MLQQEKNKVIAVNRPTKEQSEQKAKELSQFLSNMWNMPPDKKKS